MSFDSLDEGAFEGHTLLTDAIRDGLPANHTEAEFCAAYAEYFSQKMAEYKQACWLRRFWLRETSGLRIVAEQYPELFDQLVTEFAMHLEAMARPEPKGHWA